MLRRFITACHNKSIVKQWLGWHSFGYLPLEVSEFIEACRGKGTSTKEDEAADVLFCFLSMCGEHGVNINAVFDKLEVMVQEYAEVPDR